MKKEIMSEEKRGRSLSVTDLTDPQNGVHAINLVVQRVIDCLNAVDGWPDVDIQRMSPVTSVANNFDRLLFPKDNLGRSSTYTRYVSADEVLRTHTSAMIPDIFKAIAPSKPKDYLVVAPGICYRRDVIDRTHCGEPHQVDVWRVRKGKPRLEREALIELIETIVKGLMPGHEYRANEVTHPYTLNGLEVEVLIDGEWLEILECGEAHPEILKDAGLNPKQYSGLAMGIGLDRLVMIIKKIPDIRILRDPDPRIAQQMENLDVYKPVSKYPKIIRDISFSVESDYSEEDVAELIRDSMGENVSTLEEVSVTSETPYDELPPQAIERLGIKKGQKNILARLVFRSLSHSMTKKEANTYRDMVYTYVDESGTGGYLSSVKK